jgi:hypothetical protein
MGLFRLSRPETRSRIAGLLGPDTPLRGLTAINSGLGIGQVAGRDTTLCSPADYLREHGLVAMGVPGDTPGTAHHLSNGWLAVTDTHLAFVVAGWTGRPKAVFTAKPLETVALRWGPARCGGHDWRLYHLRYTHNDKPLHLVRMAVAADDDGFLERLGDRAQRIPG